MDTARIKQARTQLLSTTPQLKLPERSYLVLMSARSGSMLLCAHLEKIGFGRPVEAFNPNKNPMFHNDWAIDFHNPLAYLQTAIDFQTVNGVMGMKLSLNHFHLLLEKARMLLGSQAAGMDDAEVTEIFFPELRYIHLQRRDKVKQAISYAKAWQTGIWYETTEDGEEYKEYVLPPVYDREQIEGCLDLVIAGDAGWSSYLRGHGLTAHKIWYEDLADTYSEEMQAVYTFLGVPEKEVIAPPLKKQADSRSLDWEQRFVRETPWLQTPRIAEAMRCGDMESLLVERAQLAFRDRAARRWEEMPAHRLMAIRRFIFRARRKIGM
jgi:trehalose 2-sulfotransferase